MEIIPIFIRQIRSPKWSTKFFDDNIYHKLCARIREHGQLRNISVRAVAPDVFDSPDNPTFFEVIEGRNIAKACKEVGEEIVYARNFGMTTDLQALEINVMLNELSFKTDYVDLGQVFKTILASRDVKYLSNLAVYDTYEAKKLVDMLTFNWDDFNRKRVSGQFDMFADLLTE